MGSPGYTVRNKREAHSSESDGSSVTSLLWSLLGVELTAVCIFIVSLIVVACCLHSRYSRMRLRFNLNFKDRLKLPSRPKLKCLDSCRNFRRPSFPPVKFSSLRLKRHVQRPEVYEDACSALPSAAYAVSTLTETSEQSQQKVVAPQKPPRQVDSQGYTEVRILTDAEVVVEQGSEYQEVEICNGAEGAEVEGRGEGRGEGVSRWKAGVERMHSAPTPATSSEYNVLNGAPRSKSDSPIPRKAYDHVIFPNGRTSPAAPTTSVPTSSPGDVTTVMYSRPTVAPPPPPVKMTGNEYDVSTVAVETSRVQVIGEVYDKLKAVNVTDQSDQASE